MKIKVSSLDKDWEHEGWYIKENESGFWAYLSESCNVPFKFPWKLYTYDNTED